MSRTAASAIICRSPLLGHDLRDLTTSSGTEATTTQQKNQFDSILRSDQPIVQTTEYSTWSCFNVDNPQKKQFPRSRCLNSNNVLTSTETKDDLLLLARNPEHFTSNSTIEKPSSSDRLFQYIKDIPNNDSSELSNVKSFNKNNESHINNDLFESNKDTYIKAVEELFAKIRLTSEIEMLRVLYESIISVWDGLCSIASICPQWANHTDNQNVTNLCFHRLEIHNTSRPLRLINYFALFRNVELVLNENDMEKKNRCVLNAIEFLDTIRTNKNFSTEHIINEDIQNNDHVKIYNQFNVSYIPIKKEVLTLFENRSYFSEKSCLDDSENPIQPVNNLLQLLEDIRAALDTTTQSRTGSSTPACLADGIEYISRDNMSGSVSDQTNWDFSNVVLQEPEENRRRRSDRQNSSNEWLVNFKSSKKRQKSSSISTEQTVASDNSTDLSSPCQGVCWDPTHQRWVAHWSDSRTHQRIRRYFNPKLIGFQHARLLAVMTRREAVDSGRASMITKSERVKSFSPSSSSSSLGTTTTTSSSSNAIMGQDDPTSQNYVQGIYWCNSSRSWFAYWRQKEELLYQQFPISDFMNSGTHDENTAIVLAKKKASTFRKSVVSRNLTPEGVTDNSNLSFFNNETVPYFLLKPDLEIQEQNDIPVDNIPDEKPVSPMDITTLSPAGQTKVIYVSSPPSRPSLFLRTPSTKISNPSITSSSSPSLSSSSSLSSFNQDNSSQLAIGDDKSSSSLSSVFGS